MKSILFLGVLFVAYGYFSYQHGHVEGYHKGYQGGKYAQKHLSKFDIKKGVFGDMQKDLKECVAKYDEMVDNANSQNKRLKDNSYSCEDKLRNYEFNDSPHENLHSETVEKEEPTNYEVDDYNNSTDNRFNPITQEYEDD